jgi:predicted aconitase with swiveling domain
MTKILKGRSVIKGVAEGEAVVSRGGFNAYASFYNSLSDEVMTAVCADSGNQDTYRKILSGKILCIPNSIGSTSAGAVWQRIVSLGIAPKAVLFARAIDSLAAGGLLVADIWVGKEVFVIDKLGDELLEIVQDGDWINIDKNGTVVINAR